MMYNQRGNYNRYNSYKLLLSSFLIHKRKLTPETWCFCVYLMSVFCISYNSYMSYDVLIRCSVVQAALSSLYDEGQCDVLLVPQWPVILKARILLFFWQKKWKVFRIKSRRRGQREHLSLSLSIFLFLFHVVHPEGHTENAKQPWNY